MAIPTLAASLSVGKKGQKRLQGKRKAPLRRAIRRKKQAKRGKTSPRMGSRNATY